MPRDKARPMDTGGDLVLDAIINLEFRGQETGFLLSLWNQHSVVQLE